MIMWITGNVFIGKTHFTKWCESQVDSLVLGCKVLHIGEAMREKYGMEKLANYKSAAPAELDDEVQALVYNWIRENEDEALLFIDSLPRKTEQLDWVEKWAGEFSKHHHIVALFELEGGHRTPTTDLTIQEAALRASRMQKDESMLHRMLFDFIAGTGKKYRNLQMKVIPVIKEDDPQDWFCKLGNALSFSAYSNLNWLLRQHKKLDSLYVARYGVSAGDIAEEMESNDPVKLEYKHMSFLRDMLGRMNDEIIECNEEISRKFWDDADVEPVAVRNELVDQLHFWLTLAVSCGMTTGDKIGMTYMAKRDVNEQRIRVGKQKGDSVHVGILKDS